MSLHEEASGQIAGEPTSVFEHLDDPRRLSAHMSQSSVMMLGSRMEMELDSAEGRALGARIRLSGRMLGIPLYLEEVITERIPPRRKVWQTVGVPRLLVLSHYTMGFDIMPEGTASRLRVFIDYQVPTRGVSQWLGRLFGRFYARWCTRRMVQDTVKHFQADPAPGRLGARSG